MFRVLLEIRLDRSYLTDDAALVPNAVPQLDHRSMNHTWGELTRHEFDELCRAS
jgi:hypothetical protein